MNSLKVKRIPGKGHGVLADKKILCGDVVENCHVLKVPNGECPESLSNYVYDLGDGKHCLVALGYGSLYNHSYSPNARYQIANGKIKIVAVRDIEKGDEVTINYNGYPKSKKKVWFDVI